MRRPAIAFSFLLTALVVGIGGPATGVTAVPTAAHPDTIDAAVAPSDGDGPVSVISDDHGEAADAVRARLARSLLIALAAGAVTLSTRPRSALAAQHIGWSPSTVLRSGPPTRGPPPVAVA